MARRDKEANRAYYKKYWEAHKEEIKAKRKGRNTEYMRTYRAKHRDGYNAYYREYYRKRKEIDKAKAE